LFNREEIFNLTPWVEPTRHPKETGMSRVLLVLSSPRGEQSFTTRFARRIADDLVAREPGTEVVVRDVAANPLPHIDETFVGGIFKTPEQRSAAEQQAVARSDALIDELLAADLVVIAAPMHNFGVPSNLKAWIDHVARAGRTFRYTASGPEGLVHGKKAILVIGRGGVYSKGPMLAYDHQESHLRTVLGFIGVKDVRAVHVEGVAMGDAAVETALAHATKQSAAAVDAVAAKLALAA
jgi:FMN-dependent NADH-azoreductase